MFLSDEMRSSYQKKKSSDVYKKKVIKKILMYIWVIRISSMDKTVMKLLLKILEGGPEKYLHK